MPDEHGYPTDDELQKIRKWPPADDDGLLRYVADLWYYPDRATETAPGQWYFSTGGWSGNESIIDAMSENYVFWMMWFQSLSRGGHYCFAQMDIKQLDAQYLAEAALREQIEALKGGLDYR